VSCRIVSCRAHSIMTVAPSPLIVWQSSDPRFFHLTSPSFPSIVTSPLVSARRSARGSSRFLVPAPNEGGGGAPQGAHWVFDHAGEARCRVNGTRRSRCDRDRAPRRSTVAISGRGTTLQLRQCPPDPRCDLPAGPIARPGRLGPVPPAPRFATRRSRDATSRSVCRIVSGDAPHERERILCSIDAIRSQ